ATDHSVRNLRLVQDTRYPEQPISELFMCVHDSLQDLPLLRMDVENSCHLVLPVPTIPSKLSGRDGWNRFNSAVQASGLRRFSDEQPDRRFGSAEPGSEPRRASYDE